MLHDIAQKVMTEIAEVYEHMCAYQISTRYSSHANSTKRLHETKENATKYVHENPPSMYISLRP